MISLHTNLKKFVVMSLLKSFIIPVKGLKIGVHHFDFQLDKRFFKAVNPEGEVDGNFTVSLDFEKKYGMYELNFDVKGELHTACDRCLEKIPIPVEKDYSFIIKIGTGEDDLDVVFLEEEKDELDLSKYLYDYVLLSFPISKVIDCDTEEKAPCNMEMLDKLYGESNNENEEKKNVWDVLNNLNLDN